MKPVVAIDHPIEGLGGSRVERRILAEQPLSPGAELDADALNNGQKWDWHRISKQYARGPFSSSVWVANSQSSGHRRLKQTPTMLPPSVAIK